MSESNMSPELILSQWKEAKEKLDYYKQEENTLRKICVSEYFPEGDGKRRLPNGDWLQARKRANAVLDQDWIEATLAQLPEGVANMLINWRPVLNMPIYNALSEREKEIANQMVTFKEGMPELKIKERQK